MTALTELIPDVKGYLAANLPNAAGLSGVQVTWGHPGEHVESEYVLIGEARQQLEWASLGKRSRKAAFEVELLIRAGEPVDSQLEASLRAYALLGAVADYLMSDHTLGGRVHWAHVSAAEDDEHFGPEGGRACGITATIACVTRG